MVNLRFYIKLQSYVIAISTILVSILMAYVLVSNSDFYYPLEEFYNFRLMGSGAIVFGIIWFAVGVSLFYGILKEDKRFVYPFIPMFILDLFLFILRDMIMIYKRSHDMVFMDPFTLGVTLYITVHSWMTVGAMLDLLDPKPMAQPGIQLGAVTERAKDVGADEENQATK